MEAPQMDAITRKQPRSTPDDEHVHEVPGVCGGYPVIRRTRIPVRVIVEFHRQGADVDEIAAMYPHVGREQIQGALDYYAAHPARVDEDIARNERAWEEIIERNVHIQGRPCPD
jgi:uncharacterized protein (DUF433 family)